MAPITRRIVPVVGQDENGGGVRGIEFVKRAASRFRPAFENQNMIDPLALWLRQC